MYRWQRVFGNKIIEIVEEGLGECSQAAECLPNKREAAGSSPGPATKEGGEKERKNVWAENQPTGRHTENNSAETTFSSQDQRAQTFVSQSRQQEWVLLAAHTVTVWRWVDFTVAEAHAQVRQHGLRRRQKGGQPGTWLQDSAAG